MKNSESTNTVKSNIVREPIGRITGRINKVFFKALKKRLSYLGIEHSFFPLLLIGLGNGELTQQNLADKLMTDKTRVVHIVDYLFDNGFVLRIKNENDRREYKLHVTNKGLKAIPDIKRIFNELAAISFKGLPSGKIADLYSMLYTIINNISCLKEETE
jgi:DNA-binding MarR family transcriptional regulator